MGEPDATGASGERIAALVDALASPFASGDYADEVREARGLWDERRGRPFDDEALYAAHMTLFLQWYTLARPLAREGVPPVEVALRAAAPDDADLPLVIALARSHFSLFEIVRRAAEGLLLTDLVRGGLWRVSCAGAGAGLEPGEVMEARLIPWSGQVRFASPLVFHPREANPAIRGLLQQWQQQGPLGEGTIARLAEMRLRHSRFRNIAVERIYCERG